MGTRDFNALDLFICRWRSGQVRRHIRQGASVLDFGCGHQALFLRSVADRLKLGLGIDYDADPNPAKPAPNLEIRRFRFSDRFDLPSGSFDQITILAVLEHIPLELVDPLIAEFHRLLRPGGELLLTTPTPRSKPLLEFLAFRLKIISAPEIADHKHYYSAADVHALATRHRFECKLYQAFQFGLNSFALLSKSALN